MARIFPVIKKIVTGGSDEPDAVWSEEAELDDSPEIAVTLADKPAGLADEPEVAVTVQDAVEASDAFAEALVEATFDEEANADDQASVIVALRSPQDSWVGRPGQLLSPAGNNDGTQLQLHGLVTAERDVYIKFPTGSIELPISANVTAATLRCFQVTPLLLDLAAVTTHPLAQGSENWDESTITKANAPAPQASLQSWTQGAAATDKALALNGSWLNHLESRIDSGVDTTFVLRTGVLGLLLRAYQSADAGIDEYETVCDNLNPVSYLRLGENSGAFADTGSNALTVNEVGTVTRNATGLITSVAGDDGSISTTGANYVHLGDNYDQSAQGDELTVVAWVRMGAAANNRAGVWKRAGADPSTGNGWSLRFNGNSFQFQALNGLNAASAIGQTTDVGAGVTYCIAGVFESPGGNPLTNPRTLRVYLNGVEDGNATIASDLPNTAGNCRVGFLSDEFDEVAIFNRALSAAEMASLSDAGFNRGDGFGPRLELEFDLT